MRGLIAWFVKNPVAANLLMVAMFVSGIFGYLNLEREFIPGTTVNGMTVSVVWNGASPRDVNEQIVTRVEEAVDGLDGIDYIEATAREGGATVNVRTKLGIDYEKILDEVKNRVDGIQNLPPDAFRPQVFRWDARADIMYLALYGQVDRLTLQRAGNDLRLKLTQLPGLQLTEQISKVPEQAKVEFEQIIIRQAPNGGIVRVGDVANVIDGFDNDKFAASFRGQPAAIFRVQSPDTMNITEAGEAIRKFEEEIKERLWWEKVYTSMLKTASRESVVRLPVRIWL